MSNRPLQNVLWHLRELAAAEPATATDRELLHRFVRHHDEAAFAALVQRHGPMVLSVCRRVLRHAHDAEDACQAAFLILARKAGSIRKGDSVGSWLHGVAFRAAANLKRQVARRHAHERPAVDVAQADAGEASWREVRAVLDEELRRLPARYQAPLVLCYLEGKTRDEAAQELGWSHGTLRGRLERARELLRTRLARRGLALSTSLLATQLASDASAALPVTQWMGIVQAGVRLAARDVPAAEVVSTRVLTLMREVMRAMWIAQSRTSAAILVAVSLLGIGAGLVASGALTARPVAADEPSPEPKASPAAGRSDPKEAAPRQAAGVAQPGDAPELARQKAQSRLNLKYLTLAMHNYHDAYGHLPAPAIYGGGELPGGGEGPGGGPVGPVGGAAPGGPRVPGMGASAPAPSGLRGRSGAASGVAPTVGRPGVPPGAGPGIGGPPAAAKLGKALLSWRVAILPFLGEGELYQQFKLDEPWDSPHNKKLLTKIPKVYADPTGKARDKSATYYQVFVGPHAAFEKHEFMRFPASFPDGLSNTLLIVEAANPVPWTKPEDLHFAPDEPIPELGGPFPGLFHSAFADGAVCAISKKIDPGTLRNAIMRDDGQVVNVEPYTVPASRRTAALREQNDLLREELRRQKARVEELQKEKNLLHEIEDDAEVRRLQQEKQDLEDLLHKSRDEADQLKEEIRRLKRSSGKGSRDRDSK